MTHHEETPAPTPEALASELLTPTQLANKINTAFRLRRRYRDNGLIADTAWNGWHLDPAVPALVFVDPHDNEIYDVTLTTCTTSAEVLDRLAQVAGKNWAGMDMDKVLAGLLRALDDVLHLQSTLCGGGRAHALSSGAPRTLANSYVKRFHEGDVL